jgi:hypothetical protein
MAKAMTIIPSEDEEQATLFDWAARMQARYPELQLLHAIPNGGARHAAVGEKLKRTGVKRGVPDICLPVARHGCHGLYIELKRRELGRVSAEQAAWMDALVREGYHCALCCGWDAARDVIQRYLSKEAET